MRQSLVPIVIAVIASACGSDNHRDPGPEDPVYHIVVNPNPAVIPQMGTAQLAAEVQDQFGTVVAGATFSYVSSDPAVATVSPTGLMTSLGKALPLEITVQSDTLSLIVPVSITGIPASVVADKRYVRLLANQSTTLHGFVLDLVGDTMPAVPVTYLSTNSNAASVNAQGVVLAGAVTDSGKVRVSGGGHQVQVPLLTTTFQGPVGSLVLTDTVAPGPYGVDISDDGTVYIVRGNGFVMRGDLSHFHFTDQVTSAGNTGAVVFSASGQNAYTEGSTANAAVAIDIPSNTKIGGAGAVTGSPTDVALSTDGSTLYVSSDTVLFAVSTTTHLVTDSIPLGNVVHLAVSPTTSLLYASGFAAGKVFELNAQLDTLRSFGPFFHPQDLQVTADGSTLAVVDNNGNMLARVDLGTGTISSSPSGCLGFGMVLVNHDQQAYIGCSQSAAIHVVNVSDGSYAKTIPQVGWFPRRMAVSADGLLVVVTDEFGYVHLIW